MTEANRFQNSLIVQCRLRKPRMFHFCFATL